MIIFINFFRGIIWSWKNY